METFITRDAVAAAATAGVAVATWVAAAVAVATWVAVAIWAAVAVAIWAAGTSAARLPEVECAEAVRSSHLAQVFLAAPLVCAVAPSTVAAVSTMDHWDRVVTVAGAGGAEASRKLRRFNTTVRITPFIRTSVSASGCGRISSDMVLSALLPALSVLP
jgi:hypothetical protein